MEKVAIKMSYIDFQKFRVNDCVSQEKYAGSILCVRTIQKIFKNIQIVQQNTNAENNTTLVGRLILLIGLIEKNLKSQIKNKKLQPKLDV